jgi:nucleoside-diphosphate-sugar epimerase
MWLQFALALACFGLVAFICLSHIDTALSTTPDEVEKLRAKDWTDKFVRETYDKCLRERPNFKRDLPPKQNRRYVVTGGSGVCLTKLVSSRLADASRGLVGGWMVEHLLLRGEDPAAIRILDLVPPRRDLAIRNKVAYFRVDISDRAAVDKFFDSPWPEKVANQPLTVLHTVAYIHAGYGTADFLPPFIKVNVQGTRNLLESARAAGCEIFLSTSSASIAIKPLNYWIPPWNQYPKNFTQFMGNADPMPLDRLENFAGCYAYAKAHAEKLVTDADNKKAGFRTGAIRPGHTIYGHGDENANDLVYDYMRRGGVPT